MTQNTTTNAAAPPFPRLGEIYRVVALALDTKKKGQDFKNLYQNIDRLAREGEYDWSLLPTLCQELITKPLASHTDADFANLIEQVIGHIHKNYLGLVSTIALDSLSRQEALPLLVEHYFSRHGRGLLLKIQQTFGGPDLLALLDPEAQPISVVLDWAGGSSTDLDAKVLMKMAFPDSTDSDKTGRDMVNRWVTDTQLPDIDSLERFTDALKNKGFTQHKNLRRWLVVARALAWLEEKSPVALRKTMRQHFLSGIQDFDIGTLLSHAVRRAAQPLSALSMPALMLYDNLKRTTPKLPGDKAKTKAELDALLHLTAQHDPEGRTQFHLEWLQGRWHVLCGELEQALPFYKKAAELANYRGGEAQKRITEEALVIAGYLSDKVFLNQFKNRAIAFGLFLNPQEDKNVVEKWEIVQFRQQFHHLFPAQGRFLEVAPEQINEPEHPLLILNQEQLDSMKVDLRHPDRVCKVKFPGGQTRSWPQLRLFASIGRLDEVIKLLERGASVDKLDESNGSALLCAIQHAEQTGERAVLDLLLKQPHTKETLNKTTDRKLLTPLMCAIDHGQPDVVAQLLKIGASADRRGLIENLTPLYRAVGQMVILKSPQKLYAHTYELLRCGPTLLQQEAFRRYIGSFAGVFGDGAGWAEMLKNPRYETLFTQVQQAMMKLHAERHSSAKLVEIVRLLLAHGANPNVPHVSPVPGRTPLMLAVENNSVEVLELMLKHGGNPSIKDAAGNNCMRIAMSFSSHAAVQYLRARGVR